MTLSQKVYIDTVCELFGLQGAHPATTSIEAEAHLMDTTEDEPHTTYPYKEIIGSLMYAATAMQPDIAFATSILTQFSQNPTRFHLEAAKQVIRYLKTTCDL